MVLIVGIHYNGHYEPLQSFIPSKVYIGHSGIYDKHLPILAQNSSWTSKLDRMVPEYWKILLQDHCTRSLSNKRTTTLQENHNKRSEHSSLMDLLSMEKSPITALSLFDCSERNKLTKEQQTACCMNSKTNIPACRWNKIDNPQQIYLTYANQLKERRNNNHSTEFTNKYA